MEQYIDAGALNKRVTLLARGRTDDAFADPQADTWTEVCTVWAAISNAGAREFWEAQAAHAELTHKVTIRYRAGITADMRVRFGERLFAVIAPPVDYDMRHKYLVLKCREVTDTLYTPHTVTVYNVREDPATFETEVQITILPGVLMEGRESARARAGGLAGTSRAYLFIPRATAARDALTGVQRSWAGPREYALAADRSGLWTLDPNRDFFALGEVVDESGSFQAINAAHDGVFRVTELTVDENQEQALWHIAVGGA